MAGTRWGEGMKKSHEIGAEEEQIAWGMVGHYKDTGVDSAWSGGGAYCRVLSGGKT